MQIFVNILHGTFQYIIHIKGKKHVMQTTDIPQYIITCIDTHKTILIKVNEPVNNLISNWCTQRWKRTVYPHTVQSTHASQVTICSH